MQSSDSALSLGAWAVAKAVSGSDGCGLLSGLVAGGYDLTVSAKGFREYIQRGISVNLDQQVRIDVALEIGATPKPSRFPPTRRPSISTLP